MPFNTVTDSPKLPLSAGPGVPPPFINSVLPAVGGTTKIDVTFSYVTYATVAFSDMSIYCLGQQSWNVHYQGSVVQVLPPAPAGTYLYNQGAANADNGSAAFGQAVRNNNNPIAIGPVYGNSATAGLAWR